MTRDMCSIVHRLKPAMIMVVVQIGSAGVSVLYKLAANDGMNLRVLVAYRYMFGAAFILPLALVFERKDRPKLTWLILFQSFMCGLFGGSLIQNLYLESMALTSATFSAAMINLIPAITFILTVSVGLERLEFGRIAGKAKVAGTFMGIGGAMLLTLYKGVEIDIWPTHFDLLHKGSHVVSAHSESGHRLLGALFAIGSCMCYAMWLIVQAKMSEKYPCHYSSTALMNVMGSIQAIVFALCTERDWSQWKLGWNIRLLTVAYSGIVASGVLVVLIAWCLRMTGPLYVSVFNPLVLVFVALAGSLILDEKLRLGSILGATLIVSGLYLVLWGKGKEIKRITPLLLPTKTSGESESIDVVITSTENHDNKNNSNNSSTITNIAPNSR